MNTVEVPIRLSARPRFRGLVIPYVTMILSNGEPDFTTNDELRRIEVMQDKKCAICGEPLDYWIFFIGGEKCYENRAFIDPAMHDDCARYSMAVCPYLKNEHAKYKETTKSMGDSGIIVKHESMVSPVRPPKMGLFKTRKYEIMRAGKSIIVHAAAWTSVEWF